MWTHGARFNALYGNCRAADGRDQHVWFFAGHRFTGTDAPTASRDIVGLWRDDRTIAFLYVLYRARDPNCCPTGRRQDRPLPTGRKQCASARPAAAKPLIGRPAILS